MKYCLLTTLLIILPSYSNEKKKVEPPKFIGSYTVTTSATYSASGKPSSTRPETERLSVSYIGGDTIGLSSQTISSLANEGPIYARFSDSTFALVPFREKSSEITGSGVATKEKLKMTILTEGLPISATWYFEGLRTSPK